jgi:hypothetical protein
MHALDLWERIFWESRKYETLIGLNSNIRDSRRFNPEYFLEQWSNSILNSTRLNQDVWGWALTALRLERAYKLGVDYANDDDMLAESECFALLHRFKEWTEARLAYHRTALRLTFYADDPLADKDPLASNVERLRDRFEDWRDVRVKEQERLFENDPAISRRLAHLTDSKHFTKDEIRSVVFQSWLFNKGLHTGVITSERIEWLCWLHLIGPISRQWELHDISLAVLKAFGGQAYIEDARRWWDNPPNRVTYEPVQEKDGFAERVMKQGFPQEFHEWHAEWASKRLAGLQRFTDTLRKQLQQTDFDYLATRGRRKASKDDPIPAAWNEPREETPEQAIKDFLAILLRQEKPTDTFSPTAAKEDLEKDQPKGWLLAKSLNS